VTLVCLAELLSGAPSGHIPRSLAPAIPEEVGAPEKSPWIGASSVAPDRERELAALVDQVSDRGRGLLVITSVEDRARAANVALEVARELGQRGSRVLFVDCRVGDAQDRGKPGLSDLIFGVASFGEVIQRDQGSRIHVIAVGRGIRDTAALLVSERLSIILGALSQTYDHVVLFVPSLASVDGGARLARFARGVVLVTGEGDESAAAAAFDALSARGFPNVAVASISGEFRKSNSSRAAA
jgi:Mrp family chromosome partitioning ATPase